MLQDGKSKKGSPLDGSQLSDLTASASEDKMASAADRATLADAFKVAPADTSNTVSSSPGHRATPSRPAQEGVKASSSPALHSASSSSGKTAAIPASSSRVGGPDGQQVTSASAVATKNAAPTEAASGSPAGTGPRASAGLGGQLEGKPAESGRAGLGSAAVQSPVTQAAPEAAASQSPVSQTASKVSAEGPILKTQQHKKPAIWAAATVTGRPRGSPSPPPKPKEPQPSPAAPLPQNVASRPTQSHVQRVEYITRPQIDPLGRPTGEIEVLPASMVPTGTAPFGLTPCGITPSPPKSSTASQVDAAQSTVQDKRQDIASSPAQAEDRRVEYVARPQIDPLGHPTGQVELVPASSVPTGTTPAGTTPISPLPSEATPAGTTPAGATPAGATAAGTTSSDESSRDAVSGNVVSVSEALSKAAEKARDMSSQTGANPNQPGASPSKPGATPKQAGAVPDKAGAGVGGGDDQRWRQSKLERSTSWKTR